MDSWDSCERLQIMNQPAPAPIQTQPVRVARKLADRDPARRQISLPGFLLLTFLGLFSGLLLSGVIYLATVHSVNVPIVTAGSTQTTSGNHGSSAVSTKTAAWDEGSQTSVFVDPDHPIIKVKQKDPMVETVLVFGIDSRSSSEVVARADSLILLTIDRRHHALKLTSIMRDTQVKIKGRSLPDKINAAYAYGGAGLLINTINENFNLDIQRFAMFDFWSAANLIDAAGGVRINVTKAEIPYLNKNLREQNKLVPKSRQSPAITKAGRQLLDGRQAIAWARIRKLDSDYNRAGRQRTVMMAMIAKLRSGNILAMLRMAGQGLRHIETSLTSLDLIRLGSSAAPLTRDILQYRVPEEGLYTVIENPWSMVVNFKKQNSALQYFIWEKSPDD